MASEEALEARYDGGKEREEGSLKLTVEAVGGISMGSGQVCNL